MNAADYGARYCVDENADGARDGQEGSWKLGEFTNYGIEVLESLEFSRFIEKNTKNVSVNWHDGKIKGTKVSIEQLVKEFEKNIVTKDIDVKRKPGIQKLLLDPNGDQNETILAYIKRKLQNENVKSFHLQWRKDDRKDEDVMGFIHCCSENDGTIAKNVIETSFYSFPAGDFSDDVKKIIKEWEQKRKIVESLDSTGQLHYTCTEDVDQKLKKAFDKTIERSFPIYQQVSQFLSKCKSLLDSVSAQNNVSIDVDTDNNTLMVKGKYSNVKRGILDLEEKFPVCTVSIPLNRPVPMAEKFDKIARERQCSLIYPKIYDQYESDTLSQHCDYIMSWFDPTKDGTFTVIEGDTFDLNVDCLIVLCTDSLYPLQLKPDGEMINIQNRLLRNASEKKPNGFMVYEKVGTKLYRNVIFLVVGPSNPVPDKNDILNELSSAFKSILQRAESMKWKRVCLPAFIEKGYQSTTFILQEFLEATIGFQKRKTYLQLYFYLEKEKGMLTKNLLKSIHSRYKKEVGFFRKKMQHGLLYWKDHKKYSNPKIEVKTEPIENANTNVIVNTTTRKLVLNKGGVSNRLLELAGEELQKECKKKYPNGIDYTEIAVTSAHDLMKKNKTVGQVFHGALPKFERGSYVQNLKGFVWRCLAKAQEEGCKSIAFPSLGTGSLGYPGRESAKAMFDAVEEYRKNAVNPCVERVVFSLHSGDKDICRVFEREQRKRIASRPLKIKYSSGPYIEPKIYGRKLKVVISRKPHPVEIIIAPDEYIGPLSSNVVEIEFFSSEAPEIIWKYSDENPETYNDRLLVSCGKHQSKLGLGSSSSAIKAFETAVNYCLENGIAEIAFGFSGGAASVKQEKDVHTILAKLDECLPNRNPQKEEVIVLHTVYLCLVDVHLFEAVEKSLMSKTFPASSSSFFSLGLRKTDWKVIDSPSIDKSVQVVIIGDDVDNVQMVKQMMLKETSKSANFDSWKQPIPEDEDKGTDVDRLHDSQGARPKVKGMLASKKDRFHRQELNDRDIDGTSLSGSDDDYGNGDDNTDDNGAEKYFKVPNRVSAEINIGFIKYKKKYNDFQRWKSLAEETFSIEINESDESCCVHGTYQNLMRFKTYLDKKFPSDPGPTKQSGDSDEQGVKGSTVDGIKNASAQDKGHEACRGTENLSLSAGELESYLFISMHKNMENVKAMKYDEENSKLVISYQGSQQDGKRIKDAHKDFLQHMTPLEVKLANQDEISRVQTALEQVKNDKIFCKFFPEEDLIQVCGVDGASAKKAKDAILKYVGRKIHSEQTSEEMLESVN